ncbi:hypothetical protein ACFE04_018855 [Oxalis oulophora]
MSLTSSQNLTHFININNPYHRRRSSNKIPIIITSSSSSSSPQLLLVSRQLTFSSPTTNTIFNFTKTLNSRNRFFAHPPHNNNNNSTTTVHLDTNDFNLDALLSFSEFLCLFTSTLISIGFLVNCVLWRSKKTVMETLLGGGNAGLAAAVGAVMLVGGVVVGAWIRRRQWRRVFREVEEGGGRDRVGLNLVGRVEKLEQDLKSSVTIIRGLARQLEKLGIRFRLTRKSLKQHIAEEVLDSKGCKILFTAALAQKNSEATRTLAAQEDNLEKELGEIQKVLLLMQEQQQKQLELILAIGKSGKLFESQPKPKQEANKLEAQNLSDKANRIETPSSESLSTIKGVINDRA